MSQLELTPPTPERQALVTEWARQINSGEFYAGYWNWYSNDVLVGSLPAFRMGSMYRYEPSESHPHYAIFREWEAHKKSGAIERGEYELRWINYAYRSVSNWQPTSTPRWEVVNSYELRKTYKHPDSQKIKLIDWANAPAGTMIDKGEIVGIVSGGKHGTLLASVLSTYHLRYYEFAELRIIPSTKWTAIQDGEQPPTCDGLVIEYTYVDESGLLATCSRKLPSSAIVVYYRVSGLAEGWTDDPEKARVA